MTSSAHIGNIPPDSLTGCQDRISLTGLMYVHLCVFIDLLECLKGHGDYLHEHATGDVAVLAFVPK